MLSNLISRLFSNFKTKNIEQNDSKALTTNPTKKSSEPAPCCEGLVHIAYRGVSDDRLYIAYERKWPEVKFFRPKNLKVFCQKCRRRVY